MTSGFTYIRPKDVAYFRATGSWDDARAKAWQQMLDWQESSSLDASAMTTYGIKEFSSPKKDAYYFDICFEFEGLLNVAENHGLTSKQLPGGAFHRTRHIGSLDAIQEQIEKIQSELHAAGVLTFDTSRPIVEIYITNPANTPVDELTTDICIPVQSNA